MVSCVSSSYLVKNNRRWDDETVRMEAKKGGLFGGVNGWLETERLVKRLVGSRWKRNGWSEAKSLVGGENWLVGGATVGLDTKRLVSFRFVSP